jgi:hypothetical protein
VQRITGVSLPAWHVESKLDLKKSEKIFGSFAALEVLRQLIGPRPDDRTEAVQAAVASFTRFGFEAAAVTAFAVRAALVRRRPSERGLERTATLRFDHPYAAIAISGRPLLAGRAPADASFTGLPLFSAWVQEPEEAEEGPPTTLANGPRVGRYE